MDSPIGRASRCSARSTHGVRASDRLDLRYGASALLRMTDDALAGRPTAFYPEGRDRQRPGTLEPAPGERPADVLADWGATAQRLDERWLALPADDWATEVREPDDNPDLGTVPLSRLALARLTEVDVHGTDLGLGLPHWSATLVRVGLPTRLGWLATRRANHRAVDGTLRGSWRLQATDQELRWLVRVDGKRVIESRPAEPTDDADATIEGTARDLLALLLGRPGLASLHRSGDAALAAAFERAFPGP